ncbi:Na+/H+ antiporter NhaC family protein [Prevotella sp. PTAC]|uniref:Na+/H+ antiporter NhaC family protein n=1 Tax=Prevotella sp. PTAC TaxID=2736295 RepID=UPI00155214A9|nr:Na+/H+ antiporter NhaC family protein [Prevotella sp. PTAC]NPD54099.1 Na+/H+ antiporter NhaC family protein [Prevotella sp. PTAC]
MNKGLIALSPLLVFVTLYLVTSIVAGDFYKVPITVAFMASSVYAVIISRGRTLRQRIDIFSRGAGSEQMMLMLWIFILAGAFANSAKVMGSIDATVNLMLTILPGNMLLAGLFLASCFISQSIGTSFGTIVALAPIASGLAHSTGASVPMMVAVVVGGSFFGDNLSFISDTTIVSTSTQECKMSDKFKVNSFLVMPAAFLILIIYILLGNNISSPQSIPDVEYTKVIPYIVVLITAVCGLNVMAVLALGISLTGLIGLLDNSFDTYGWFKTIGDGITGMGELIIITMLAGGMLELIKVNGGIDYIIKNMTRRISGKRGAELSIAALVSIVTMCTANNTVAIITVGGIARRISQRFGLDNRKCASILDTMSCFTQGLLPYGAHLLLAAGIASTSPMSLIPYLYYPFCIGAAAVLAIIFRYPKRYS